MNVNIQQLLGYALESGASDLHLSSGSIPMVRIHGEMKKLQLSEMDDDIMHNILNEILNDNQKEIFREKLEIDFSTSLEGRGRFRVNFFQQLKGLAAVFRTIPEAILSIEELGVPPLLSQLVEKEKGLILMTGPTGSGKSTTLAAMIDHLNDIENNIQFVSQSHFYGAKDKVIPEELYTNYQERNINNSCIKFTKVNATHNKKWELFWQNNSNIQVNC